jgi:hypothetical protein
MRKRIAIAVIVFAVLGGLFLLARHYFEIYPKKAAVPALREVAGNPYYGLEHWLAETGHPVRVKKQGSAALIAAGPEKAALVQAELCDWENAAAILRPWIEQGGFLVINLEGEYYDEALEELLASFGIWPNYFLPEVDKDGEESEEGPALREETAFEEEEKPSFDQRIQFFAAKGADVFSISPEKEARLMQASYGAGALTVIGRPRFMFNTQLKKEINARLAWNLTGAQTPQDNPGLLFIRGRRTTKGLLGKIAERGNFLPLGVSVLILIVLGFWMVIPVFGPVFTGKQTSAKPIRERFLAEISFLKKNKALYCYAQTYERELKLEHTEQPVTYREVINRLRYLQTILEKEKWHTKI